MTPEKRAELLGMARLAWQTVMALEVTVKTETSGHDRTADGLMGYCVLATEYMRRAKECLRDLDTE